MIHKQSIKVDNYKISYLENILKKFKDKSNPIREANLSILLDSPGGKLRYSNSEPSSTSGHTPIYIEFISKDEEESHARTYGIDTSLKYVAAVIEEMTLHYDESIIVNRIDFVFKILTDL